MKTYKEFFDYWNGKGCDFDGVFSFQCVDLADQYAQDVVGFPLPGVNGAKDFWNFTEIKGYTKLSINTTTMQRGDIVIFGPVVGPYGHVSIFDRYVNGDNFFSWDQNWGVGTLVHLQQHSLKGVLGVFRPNNAIITPTPQQPMDQKYSFRQVIQFYYRIFCNTDPSEDEYKHWEDMQKGGWNEIQIGIDIANNDSRSIAHNTNLANLTIKQLAQAIVAKS